jgi:hypothetical protein
MVVEVDVIIIRAFPSLYHFHLVTPAARKWVKKNVKEHHDKAVNVMEVETKFAWDIAYGMDCDGCGSPRTRRRCFHEGGDLRPRQHLQRLPNL